MLIDEHFVKEAQGDYSIETAPGVYYFYNTDGSLVSTVHIRGDKYTVKFKGTARDMVYAERQRKVAELGSNEFLDQALGESAVVIDESTLPKWV